MTPCRFVRQWCSRAASGLFPSPCLLTFLLLSWSRSLVFLFLTSCYRQPSSHTYGLYSFLVSWLLFVIYHIITSEDLRVGMPDRWEHRGIFWCAYGGQRMAQRSGSSPCTVQVSELRLPGLAASTFTCKALLLVSSVLLNSLQSWAW